MLLSARTLDSPSELLEPRLMTITHECDHYTSSRLRLPGCAAIEGRATSAGLQHGGRIQYKRAVVTHAPYTLCPQDDVTAPCAEALRQVCNWKGSDEAEGVGGPQQLREQQREIAFLLHSPLLEILRPSACNSRAH